MSRKQRHVATRRVAAVLVAVVVVAFAADVTRAPARQCSARLALAAIRFYQAHIVGFVGASGLRCRFEPSCSVYAEVVIARFGMLHGGWLAVQRLARCGPWTPVGTLDPPPEDTAKGVTPSAQ